ncbi:MAG: hypothetical protein ABSG31_14380 [Tepidisphaeraceae bacterium]|jgi:hypothetical protein
MALLLHNRPVESVFQLLGENENDITFSVGWVLSQSREFCAQLVKAVCNAQLPTNYDVRLQQHITDGGFTDIEIVGADFHLIVEAKRGCALPTDTQLTKYSLRISKDARNCALVVMSSCSQQYVKSFGAIARVNGVPVSYLDWKQVYRLASQSASRQADKFFLQQLHLYLGKIMDMQDQESNIVYVVSLAVHNPWEWSALTPVEFVTKKKSYFHPYGLRGWPTTPPNYLGFRYFGQLQSIHHVEHCEVVKDLSRQFREIDKKKWRRSKSPDDPHLLYSLGPAILPQRQVRTGRIFRSGRVHATLDLLLTCSSIAEARDRTIERRNRLQA